VWSAGSNPQQGTYDNRMEIYKPAYLFKRQRRAGRAPVDHRRPGDHRVRRQLPGEHAERGPTSPPSRSSATRQHPPFDMDQRMISLAFARGTGKLTVTGPPNANIAPPATNMLFIVDTNGVPSVAPFVQVSSNPGNQPPRGAIDSPAGDVTISAGQPVSFAGSGTDTDGRSPATAGSSRAAGRRRAPRPRRAA